MKKVYSSQNFTLASLFKNILEENRIRCVMENEHISNLGGEVPTNECWPEVWVLDDLEYDRAMAIINDNNSDIALSSEGWKCRRCGEFIEGQFSECWQCGVERD